MGKVIARALLCGAAAILGWILTEPGLPKDILNPAWARQEAIMVFIAIGFIGLVAGFHQGYLRGGRRNLLMGAALGFVLGSVGGHLGYMIGGGLSTAMFGPNWPLSGFPIIPRTMTFMFLGGFLGLGIGFTQLNWRTILSGLIGGLIGGGLAGMVFDPLGTALGGLQSIGDGRTESGTISRAVMWALIGFNVGLFTALVENATRQAWVRLVLGRNEGREWPVDAAQTNIGRDERAHIPLFGDQNVAPLHAIIMKEGNSYVLHDPGSPIGIGINGQRLMQPAYLNNGDTINIAGHQLQFLMKAGAAQRASEGRSQAYKVGGPQMQQQPMQPIQHQPMPTQGMANLNQTQAYTPQQAPQQVLTRALVALNGPITGQRYPLAAPLELGREGTGVSLPFDTQASRKHAVLSPAMDSVQVQDLGSTNGTYLNGARVQSAAAKPGDVIQIGSTQFRVE